MAEEGVKTTTPRTIEGTEGRPSGPRVAGLAEPRFLNDAAFNGYGNVTVRPPVVKLTDQDLNTVVDTGINYYAEQDNDCGHRPTAGGGFGLRFISTGSTTFIQEYTDKGTGKIYRRDFDGTSFGDWYRVYTTKDKPTSVDVNAISVSGIYAKEVNDSLIPKNIVVEGGES